MVIGGDILANFANLTAALNLNIQNFAQNMRRASATANQFASNLQGQINAGLTDPAKKAKFEFKDVARIVQGILISKAFYGGLNAIRNATGAVWEFSQELEYAQMVYSNLFGSQALATEFINVLKDFSAVTPFTFKQSEDAAKRLLAYGIEYKNIMYVMQGVLAAATVQGNDAVIEPISRAFGQIYTKGRLMNEEMRQLAEAGIPAYEILREKLGLTQKQLQNLGKTAIPASVAINALVEGINERFSTTLQYASMTTKGIISNIKDNATMLFAGMFSPLTGMIKNALGQFGNFIAELRKIYELKGLGGVFERLIPPELQQEVRQLVANFQMLWQIIKTNLGSILKVLQYALVGLIKLFNALAPILIFVAGVFTALAKAITSNSTLMKGLTILVMAAAGAWLVYKTQAILAAATAGLIKIIVAAVKSLVIALNFVVAHPVWALLALGVGIFIALSGASEKFRNSVNNLFKGLYSLGGVDTSKTLLPESKKRASDLSKFNKALDGTGKGMDDLSKKAGKASKSLLSFDEVFSLKSPDEGNAADQWKDFMDGIGGGMDFSDMKIEMPDVGGIATDFIDNLIESLGGKDKLLAAGIGSLLGAAIGMIIGGPIGAKIGAVLGGLAGWFWPQVAKALGLTDVGTVALPIAAGLGTAIGFLVGGPLGAVIGTAIGALVGWIIDSITRGLEQGDWSKVGLPVGMGIGAAIGFLVGGPLGAAIGAAIGALVGWIVDMFVKGFTQGDWDVSGLSLGLGTGIGAAIGMIAGGPVGALIGAAIGALVGWIVGLIVDNWNAIANWFAGIGNWFAGVGKSIGDFFVGIGNGIAEFFGGIGQWFADGWNTISTFFSNLMTGIGNFFTSLGEGIVNVAKTIFQPVIDAAGAIWGAISPFLTDIWNGITTVFTDIFNAVSTVFTNLFNAISTVLGRILETAGNILGFIKDLFVKWGTDIWNAVSTKFGEIWTEVSTKMQDIWNTITEKLAGVWNTVSEKFQEIWNVVTEKLSGIWNTVSQKFQDIWNTVSTKLASVWSTVSQKFQDIWNTISTKLASIWSTVSEKFQAIWNVIKEKLSGAWNSVKEFFGNMCDSVKTKIGNMYDSVKTGIANIYNAFKNWISDLWSNVFGKFFDWIDSGIQKLREFFGLDSKAKNTDTSYATKAPTTNVTKGHAIGGVFNREHVARFAEGNKAEAIVPLENDTAMQPFVTAVADGLASVFMPMIAAMQGNNESQLRPLYVGTLIADERSLKELNRKMQVIQLEEDARRG